MRKGGPTPEEQLAFRIVERERSVTLDLSRELEAPNQGDAVLLASDGRPFAGLEVTTICDKARAESERLLSKDRHRWHFPGLRWWWSVELPAGVRHKDAKTLLPAALRLFEAHGISRRSPATGHASPARPNTGPLRSATMQGTRRARTRWSSRGPGCPGPHMTPSSAAAADGRP